MAIRMRRGLESELNISKAVPGEWLVSTDTKKIRICVQPGIVKEIASVEEVADVIKNGIESIQEAEKQALSNISDGVDETLSVEGKAAEAKVTGEKISQLSSEIADINNDLIDYDNGKKLLYNEWIHGSIESDGSIWPYQDRITMANIVTADRDIQVTITSGYKIIYVEYNSDLTVKARYANHTADFIIAKGTIYRISIYPSTSTGESGAEMIPISELSDKVTTNTNISYEIDRLKKFEHIIVTVDATATESEFVYNKFSDGLAKAMEYKNAILNVKAHTYDIISELGGGTYTENYQATTDNTGLGLRIGNGVKIIAEENTILQADYSGINKDFGFNFSILNVIGSFEMDGLTLKARNIRYCVHEDIPVIDTSINSYTATYKNCKMYHYGNNEYGYSGVYCIGAGVYHNSRSEIENCYFYADGEHSDYPVEYHNYATDETEHSTVIIKDCYFDDDKGVRLSGFASMGSIIDAFVTNNRLGRDIVIINSTDRVNLKAWNNEVQ